MKKVSLFLFFSLLFTTGWSQTEEEAPHTDEFLVEEVDDTTKRDRYIHFFKEEDLLEWEPEEEEIDFKEKKKKRKVYYGFKTKRGFTKKGRGSHMEVEVFHYLKVPQEPSPYIKDIYWYNVKRKKIERTTPNRVDEDARILHGPYKRIVGNEIIEKGVYYIGSKHGRWEEWKAPKIHKYKDSIEVEEKVLISKEKYNRGFSKESELSFYDSKKEKIKEVIPIVDGTKEGYYFYFFENGRVSIQGRYENDEKVGKWYEYHNGIKRHFKKRITVYPDKFSKENFEPYVLQEWDETGHLIYDKEEADKQKAREEKEKAKHNQQH